MKIKKVPGSALEAGQQILGRRSSGVITIREIASPAPAGQVIAVTEFGPLYLEADRIYQVALPAREAELSILCQNCDERIVRKDVTKDDLFTDGEKFELRRISLTFSSLGGRNVDLAERIDALTAKQARPEGEQWVHDATGFVWCGAASDVHDYLADPTEGIATPGEVSLLCPWCHGSVVEVDRATRWNDIESITIDDSGEIVVMNINTTGPNDFEGDGWLCESCLEPVDFDPPAGFGVIQYD